MHAHHIFRRSIRALRWDIRNGVCLCWRCHGKAGDHPAAFMRWLEIRMDEIVLYMLRKRARIYVKVNLLDIKAELESVIKWAKAVDGA
jgi:hypothetical protein